ncbi:DUF5658 family protein [Candidatus Clostridium radicumherbarum]|uniref:DUF5658 family protein n=1 Tax=Candidatus Clostridium radicumherbarum TaxID=3381662 RepID=A0ABW8TWL6_9CLOT
MLAVEDLLYGIKMKFIALTILNITDVLATLILINIGFCVEVNIFMQNIIQAPLISIAVKTFIPAVLLYFLYHRLKLASEKQIRIAAVIINAGLGLYILINISHVVWLTMYFSFY